MRILWVKAGKLLPVDTGGRIRSFNILKHLSARHEVTLLSYYTGAADEAYEAELAHELPGAIAVAIAGPASVAGLVLDYARHLPASAPYAVTKFTSPIVRRRIEELSATRRPDVAVCDFLTPSLAFPSSLAVPAVLFQHNVESA